MKQIFFKTVRVACPLHVPHSVRHPRPHSVRVMMKPQAYSVKIKVSYPSLSQFHGPKSASTPESKPEPEPTPTPESDTHQKQDQKQRAWDQAAAAYETVDGDQGRIEIRRYWQVSDLTWLDKRSQWKHLQSIGMVEAERPIGDQIAIKRRDYLSRLASDVTTFAHAVRGHWGIENSVHWVLDVAFREDESRIRKGFAPANFAVLRHIALNVLRQDRQCPRGIPTKRLKAGWDNDYLAHLLVQAGGEQ